MSAAETASLTEGMTVTGVFVRFPAGDAEALRVSGTIAAAVKARGDELTKVVRAEITSLEKEMQSAGGSARERLSKLISERRAALTSIGPNCACVYAIAVEGTTLSALWQLQKDPRVLLVDVPSPVTDTLAGWELTPISPSTTSA
jgi:hypothetical protein